MFPKTTKNGCLKLWGRYFIWIGLKQFICIQQTRGSFSAFNWNVIELLLVNYYYHFYSLCVKVLPYLFHLSLDVVRIISFCFNHYIIYFSCRFISARVCFILFTSALDLRIFRLYEKCNNCAKNRTFRFFVK